MSKSPMVKDTHLLNMVKDTRLFNMVKYTRLFNMSKSVCLTPGVCAFIKNKINTKKRLIKLNKRNFSLLVHSRISLLSREIAIHFHKARRSRVQYHATKGGLNLWLAVKLAKDINIDEIPTKLIQYYWVDVITSSPFYLMLFLFFKWCFVNVLFL